ncbi:MAG: hypothetical protein JNJ85_12440, partial [Candidatus Kapabacteria bacterium]|nr:hypothetical protein [Candidatus Kapabacteria bacterium]
SVVVQLTNTYKILGTENEVYGQFNNTTIIKNVIVGEVAIEINSNDFTKFDVETVQNRLFSELATTVTNKSNTKYQLSSTSAVIGIQAFQVLNLQEPEFFSSQPFWITEKSLRIPIIANPKEPSKWNRPLEVVFQFAESDTTNKSNFRKYSFDFYGTGGVIDVDANLDLNNPRPFSYIIPSGGKDSHDEMHVLTIDFVRLSNADLQKIVLPDKYQESVNYKGIPFKINVLRTVKKIKVTESGLELIK